MADNVSITPGTGTNIAADDVGGVLHQRVKISVGVDGSAGDMSAGSGVIDATTPRVTLATDDASLAALDTLNTTILAQGVDIGTAGTPSADVLSVQGVSGMTAIVTGGNVAHDAADSGNPSKLGAKAISSLSSQTLVSDGDRTNLHAGLDGALFTRGYSLGDIIRGRATATDTTATTVIAAQGSGVKAYLTSITAQNSSSTNTTLDVISGSTTIWSIPVPANAGAALSFPVPLPPNAANEALKFQASTGVTTLTVCFAGFKSQI